VLERLNQPTKAVVEAAMQEHIIAQAELIGTRQKIIWSYIYDM